MVEATVPPSPRMAPVLFEAQVTWGLGGERTAWGPADPRFLPHVRVTASHHSLVVSVKSD